MGHQLFHNAISINFTNASALAFLSVFLAVLGAVVAFFVHSHCLFLFVFASVLCNDTSAILFQRATNKSSNCSSEWFLSSVCLPAFVRTVNLSICVFPFALKRLLALFANNRSMCVPVLFRCYAFLRAIRFLGWFVAFFALLHALQHLAIGPVMCMELPLSTGGG